MTLCTVTAGEARAHKDAVRKGLCAGLGDEEEGGVEGSHLRLTVVAQHTPPELLFQPSWRLTHQAEFLPDRYPLSPPRRRVAAAHHAQRGSEHGARVAGTQPALTPPRSVWYRPPVSFYEPRV